MQHVMSIACFLSAIRPPGVQFDNALLQIAPVDKYKCPFINDRNDVNFQLYTKYNPTVYQTLLPGDDEKLFASNLDFHLPTVIFFHAFMERSDDGSGVAVREAYMQRADTNVIMVDAQTLEAGPWYFTAAENTWFIGRYAAQFIDYLVSRGLDLSKTHLVGHSLGAQAAGVAGASLKSGRVARITGLDPALPLFSKLPLGQRLDPSDADFVDVIHTDAGIFGYAVPMGHADFYPNGGISPQPGCELEVVLHQQQFFNKFFCSHWRSYMFYAESVLNPAAFTAKQCESYQLFKHRGCEGSQTTHMGLGVDLTTNFLHISGENETQQLGFYTFYLTANKRIERFEKRLEKFFTHSQKAKTKPEKINEKGFNFKDLFQSKDTKHFFESIKRKAQDDNKEIKKQKERKLKVNVDKHNKEKVNHSDSLSKMRDHAVNKTEARTNKEDLIDTDIKNKETATTHKVIKRQKRFIPFFKRSEPDPDNFLFKMLDFLLKNRKNVVPVFSVMREINTLVKSANGELNHVSKERNNYIGAPPPTWIPVTYNLELANENKAVAFMKKLFGLTPKGDRLSISGK